MSSIGRVFGRMISLANSFKIYVANSPVDFRKGMDWRPLLSTNSTLIRLMARFLYSDPNGLTALKSSFGMGPVLCWYIYHAAF
jgi:hypothetical protein